MKVKGDKVLDLIVEKTRPPVEKIGCLVFYCQTTKIRGKKMKKLFQVVSLLCMTTVTGIGWVSADDVSVIVSTTGFSIITDPTRNVDKIPANTPITIALVDTTICGDVCTNRPGIPNTNMVLHWSPVDANGTWTSPTDTPMTFTSGPTCGSGQEWKATIPGQPAFTRIEFVLHSFGTNGDFWIKDAGKPIATCAGDTNQKGWGRLITTNGPNFYYTTIETPYVVIDFPQENEIIRSPTYTIRIGTNKSTNNVRVKIDTGDWSQARFDSATGFWWFDWANYPAGAHTIIAEGWNELGQRSETTPRNCTFQP